jgi:type IX secretion system PorP/SprF family membrane protein
MKRSDFWMAIFALITFWGASTAYAQDPQYTQFYSNQPMLNPAFTGAALGPRVSMNYRAQWVAIPGSFRQAAVGYDQPIGFGKHSMQGIGGLIQSDMAGEGHLAKLNFQLNYSFAIEFGKYNHEQYLRFGLSGGLEQASIDILKLRFSDQIDQRDGFIYATQEQLTDWKRTRWNPDINFGVGYYNEYAWAGVTVSHLTEPRQEFTASNIASIDSKLPRKYTVTAGLRIPVGPANDADKVTISPTVLFMKQRNFNQLNIGTYLTIDPMIFGIWWRSNYNNFNGDFVSSDMIAGLIGFKEGIFSIGYSYDYTISLLSNGISGGSHELALIMEFERNQPVRFRHKKMPCPRF